MSPPCCRTATCASRAAPPERESHDRRHANRSDHPSGHRRRAALHRRADGQRALSHVLFLDHPREPGPWRGSVRPRLQHALRNRILRRCISARCQAICAASRSRSRSTPGSPGDCVDPQSPVLRREPFARHRHRHAGLLRGRARRLLRQHRPSRRYRLGDAWPHHRRARRVRRGDAVQRPQALRRGQAQRISLALYPRQHPRARPGHGRP